MPNHLFSWLDHRGAGVLLHPTSFPGTQGIGTLDENADRFLGFLAAAGCTYWQICPLGPTGYGDSPYQCFSAFAGNPYLIDLQQLVNHRILEPSDLVALQRLDPSRVDYAGIYNLKWPLLFRAHETYRRIGSPAIYGDFQAYQQRHTSWLAPYCYFRALKDHHGGKPWWEWPAELRDYPSALRSPLHAQLATEREAHAFTQYVFSGQWERVKAVAKTLGIRIIGDLPIFVAADGADIWTHPRLFELDGATQRPRAVAGVPPDYFSADGQLWGNPLYAWTAHAADSYAWWRARLAAAFEQCDVVRIDHFRGFQDFWRIPAGAKTAREGAWAPGPGLDFFRAIRDSFPGARIIAEDLGLLNPQVVALRDQTGLPGMAVLQFAFGGEADNTYLPHNLVPNSVIYPGTHDNNTTLGWYDSASEAERDHVRRYLRVDGSEIGWDFIRTAYGAVSRLAIVSLQDILSLGSGARFNSPGIPAGNWQWRYRPSHLESLNGRTAAYLHSLADLTGRLPSPKKATLPAM